MNFKRDLLVGASILALGFAAASDASAGSRNSFSPGATANASLTGNNANVTIGSGNVSTDVTAINVQTAGFVPGTINMNASAAAASGGDINNASIVLSDRVLQQTTGSSALNFNTGQKDRWVEVQDHQPCDRNRRLRGRPHPRAPRHAGSEPTANGQHDLRALRARAPSARESGSSSAPR